MMPTTTYPTIFANPLVSTGIDAKNRECGSRRSRTHGHTRGRASSRLAWGGVSYILHRTTRFPTPSGDFASYDTAGLRHIEVSY
jgi:hypothetical protein